MAPAGASVVAPAASWNAHVLLSALFWRLLCYFIPSRPAFGPISNHFGKHRPPKKHEFLSENCKIMVFVVFASGAALGLSSGLLGLSWGLLATSYVSPWGHLGNFLGASWRFPGDLLGLLGGILEGPSGNLPGPPGASGVFLGTSRGPVEGFLGTSCLLAL